ncbi:ABC transporter ATP-binding protein [Demetria terragena]|uniref:ABC transporter ATP-binding protein n=1 Tax=Demetria terragena TaxID=63959 RepID=UPI00036277BC|nr:ABC transporter ATP-binding protein [Demetria terragena]
MSTTREGFASAALIARAVWAQGSGHGALALMEMTGRVLEYLLPLFAGLIVSGVTDRNLSLAVIGGVGLSLSQGFTFVLTLVGVESRLELQERVGHHFDQRTGTLSGESPTLDHLEHPGHQDQMQALGERLGVLGNAYNMLVNVLNNLAGPIVTLIIAVYVDWRLLLLMLIALPTIFVTRASIRWEGQAEQVGAAAGRRSAHLMKIAISPVPASELRVLGARAWATNQLVAQVVKWRQPHIGSEVRTTIWSSVVSVVYLGCAAGLLVSMVRDTFAGRLDPGKLVTSVLVITQIQEAVLQLQYALRGLAEALRAVGRYRWLEQYTNEVAASHTGTESAPKRLSQGIRLEGVRFRYPGAERDALGPVDVELPAGAVVAVVGENGAGKSTLIKALTGMYDLDEGRVLVDGQDLRELDLAQWRSRCSGAFQDHARLEVTAREAVALGEPDILREATTVDQRVHTALESASASDLMTSLPDGLDTMLGPSWPGGVDLSGGQWQRLAVARGMVRENPLLLVLDEPTSALDPATEHALFERYAAAAHSTGRRGGVTLLVTHRFSTVAAADLVVVLAEGKVVEVGTHTELSAAGGRYAELYALQAAGYR